MNFDLSILNESDETNYLVISTDDENKGTIVNISLGACSLFGYTKNEIIGKKLIIQHILKFYLILLINLNRI